jgi:2-polyprenyl-6-methoxyphenol hydroxylase-like FAD-dependent oxidoreductase
MSKGLVLIVGAGPTGLVLALWLTRLGVHVRIIDKAPEPGTTSRAVAVQARTLELYRQVNISDAVVGGGVQVAAANLWVRGAQVARLPLGRLGEGLSPFPYALTYPQDAHERLLIERLNALSVRVERRTELLRFNEEAHSVRAVLRRPNGSEEVCEAAYLAGCDGASSIVREALGTGFPGGTYSGVFYVADVNADGLAANGEIHVELDEADFLAVFPLKRTGHLRLIGPVSRAPSRDEELTFADIELRAIGKLKLAIASVNWFSTYRVHHRVATRFRVGRAFLLGDAAHIHSPVGGQGMNTGIGDAVNLAWKLAAVLNHGAGDELLATYEIERIGFARRLVATTDRAFSVVTRRGGIARLLRTRLVPAVAAKLFRFAAMRRLFFRTVSQIGVNYRDSPLSIGTTGAVRGGDRLPWVETGPPGEDNFAPLASLRWQVHIYGEPQTDVAAGCVDLGLPLHVFAWQPGMRSAGLRRDALYLVRPDGYIALAEPRADPQRLRGYFEARSYVGQPGSPPREGVRSREQSG